MAKRFSTRSLVLAALMGALLMTGKQLMSGLPNIEPVSFLIVLFTLELRRETPWAIAVFVLLQGLLYGFGIWWVSYLYVWYVLMFLTLLFARFDHPLFWAVVSGAFGLCFGALCAAIYLATRDWAFAVAWWVSGLPYDALHGAGNFAIMLLLYRPVRRALHSVKQRAGV